MSVFMAYKKDGVKHLTPIRTREEYLAHRNTAAQRMILGKVRKGNEKMKNSLVQMVYSCLPNDDGTLRGSKRMSNTVGMDIDHIPAEQMEPIKQRILEKKDELGSYMVEVSARGEGYHLAFRRRPELTQEENLKWASEVLGVKFDEGAKDITRVFYTTTEKELVYLDDALFEIEEVKESQESRVESREELGNENQNENENKSSNSQILDNNNYQSSIVNCQLDSRVRYIAQQVLKEKNLSRSVFLDIGGRHTAVKVFLTTATQLLNKGEINGVLKELMPEHWSDKNIQQLVSDYYKNYTDPNKPLTKFQEEVFTSSQKLKEQEADGEEKEVNEMAVPPVMPAKLPKLIELITSKTPDKYKGAVSHATFPPLATHLCGVRFRYTDNVEHEATLMNCLMAGTGAGKGCIDEPIRRIMADIKRRDAENERREAEWKKDCQKKGANKDRMMRPEGLVIQIIDPDMTKPALVTRMDEAEGHFVYVKLNELDLFEQLRGQTGKQHFQLMCLAFDPGAEYGQTRVGTQSVTARPVCRFNWNACTTVLKGRRFFSRVLTDGPISRINFCTIPEEEIGAEQPVYGQYDAEFDEALKPYIDNLVAARGLIDCPQAFKLAKTLQEECAEFARMSQNEVYWNLSHRACVIAWLKACVLYVANGQKWEKAIEDFVRWSLNYDLWCKMQFFGEDIEKATNGDGARIGSRGPRNLLELLPDVFTLDDAKRVRQQQGMTTNNTSKMVSQWKSRGYILQLTVDSFQKSGRTELKIKN